MLIPTNTTNWNQFGMNFPIKNIEHLYHQKNSRKKKQKPRNVHSKLNAFQEDPKTGIFIEIQTHFFNINKQKIITHEPWEGGNSC